MGQDDTASNGTRPDTAPARLAGAVLAEEAKRQQVQADRSADVVLPDDLLPGVDAEPMGLRETLRSGGLAMMLVIVLITVVEEFNRQTTTVLGPDIQDTFAITDTKLVGLASFGGRRPRPRGRPPGLAGRPDLPRASSWWPRCVVASLGLLLAAASVNTFQLFWAFTLIGFGAAYSQPGVRLADRRPVPHPGPGPGLRPLRHGHARRPDDRPVRRRRHLRPGRRPGGLALGLRDHRRRPRRAGHHRLGVPEGPAPGPSRAGADPRRAARGRARRAGAADHDRHRLPADEEDQDVLVRLHRPRRPRLRARSRSPCSSACSSGTATATAPTPGAGSSRWPRSPPCWR